MLSYVSLLPKPSKVFNSEKKKKKETDCIFVYISNACLKKLLNTYSEKYDSPMYKQKFIEENQFLK